MWVNSSQLLHGIPPCWGFSDLGRGVSPQGCSREAQSPLLTFVEGYIIEGHSKYLLPTTQGNTYTWTSPGGQYQNQIDYNLYIQRWRSSTLLYTVSIQKLLYRSSTESEKTRLGADCGSDHEFLIGKFRLILKKVGKPTRTFRDDLNQIPYNRTVQVRNRFRD